MNIQSKTSTPNINLELNFHPKETNFPSTSDFKLITDNNYPVYYDINNNYNKGYISITYKLCYIYNCTYGLLHGILPRNSKNAGYHEIDREYIRILINKKTLKPEIVYFSAHDNEGKWVMWDKCEKNKNGDLKVFIAYCSHANYPNSGTWCRIIFLGNDKCSINGRIILPKLIPEKFNLNITNDDSKSSSLKNRLVSFIYLPYNKK